MAAPPQRHPRPTADLAPGAMASQRGRLLVLDSGSRMDVTWEDLSAAEEEVGPKVRPGTALQAVSGRDYIGVRRSAFDRRHHAAQMWCAQRSLVVEVELASWAAVRCRMQRMASSRSTVPLRHVYFDPLIEGEQHRSRTSRGASAWPSSSHAACWRAMSRSRWRVVGAAAGRLSA